MKTFLWKQKNAKCLNNGKNKNFPSLKNMQKHFFQQTSKKNLIFVHEKEHFSHQKNYFLKSSLICVKSIVFKFWKYYQENYISLHKKDGNFCWGVFKKIYFFHAFKLEKFLFSSSLRCFPFCFHKNVLKKFNIFFLFQKYIEFVCGLFLDTSYFKNFFPIPFFFTVSNWPKSTTTSIVCPTKNVQNRPKSININRVWPTQIVQNRPKSWMNRNWWKK